MSPARSIAFLSDYGLEDEFVGVCHAVMAQISPESTIVDLSHLVPPQDVLAGALILSRAIRSLPPATVIVAVVDPGVGTVRRSIAVETRTDGRLLVGPDNGLLSIAWAEDEGITRAVEITAPNVLRQPVSATFHGRDIFAPAAAHLAAGFAIEELGPSVDLDSLTVLSIPEPVVRDGRIDCQVLSSDRFGNIRLSARAADLETAGVKAASSIEVGSKGDAVSARRVRTFGDVREGELALIVDSVGGLGLVVNKGSAAERLGLRRGDTVTLRGAEAVA
ncbi:MAG TPA: SAM-dependent chlorinase/fluorinase [Actinomycetota bacterium]|nr:SAM-dependent chlorinase/fluorinase [Actinomycetota bacterium]